MKLYRHLAWDGIRKNSRLYVPYLLTGVGAVSFFYILVALSRLPEGTLPGSGSVQVILNLGSFVLWVFSLLLLFYTHSFLIRRRNREFALYNVLGMGKRDIARILCWETLLSGGISLAGGLALGILLGKLAELGLLRMVGAGQWLEIYTWTHPYWVQIVRPPLFHKIRAPEIGCSASDILFFQIYGSSSSASSSFSKYCSKSNASSLT